jgi:hypothetical protein
MQTVLTEVATTAARETGLIRRQRAMSGAQFVQTLVFGWLANPDARYDDLVDMAADLGATISAPALCDWFSEQSVDCLSQVLDAAVAQVVAADPVAIPLLARFPAVFLQDSTVISLPTELAEPFAGCGGSQGATAALKAQLRLEVRTGRVDGPLFQAGRASDRAVAFRERPPVGSLTIRDLGYFQLDDMCHDQRTGRHWLSRLKPQTAVFRPDGTRVNVCDWLDGQGTTLVDADVQIGVAQRIPVRLLAIRVPQEVADQRRRRMQADARKKGRTVRAETLAACDWTVMVTTVPADQLSVTEALVLLRLRWQIELLFKLWKDHGHLDESRGQRPVRVLTEVYAKFVAMIVQHWLLLTGCWAAPDRSLPKAATVLRQQIHHLVAGMRAGGQRLLDGLEAVRRRLAQAGRQKPRHTHPNAYQLLLDPSLLSLT